jgi:hypothetical protein
MAIYGCGLPVRGCQPAVAGGFIYADLRSELSTHLALQALFTQSPVREPLLPAFPFPSTLGEVTLPLLQAFLLLIAGRFCCSCRPVCLFTAHMGGGSFPLSCGVFLPLPLSQAFPLLVAGCTPLLPPSPARPGLFIYSSGTDSPPPLFRAQGAPPSLLRVFILIAYSLVSLFSLGGGGLSKGLC